MHPGRKSLLSYLPPLIYFLTAVFFVLKEQRAFTEAETNGGLWNYIQLFFIGLAGLYPLYSGRGGSNIFRAKPLVYLLAVTFLIFLISFFRMKGMSRATIYYQLMTLYPLAVSILYFYIGYRTEFNKKTALYYGYYIAAFVLIISLYRFFRTGRAWTQRGAVADVYYILGLLPLMMAYVRGKKATIPILVCAISIAFSGKRAGMLAMFLMIAVYYLLQYAPEVNDVRRVVRTLFVISIIFLVLTVIGIYLDNVMHLRIVERLSRMIEDGGSGRLSRWTYLIHAIPKSTISEILLGREYDEMAEVIGGHAHNDILELLYINGFFAFALYLAFFISFLKTAITMSRQRYEYAPHFAMSFVCSFMVANLSFFMTAPTYTTSGMLCLGIFLGHYVRIQANPQTTLYRERRRRVGNVQPYNAARPW